MFNVYSLKNITRESLFLTTIQAQINTLNNNNYNSNKQWTDSLPTDTKDATLMKSYNASTKLTDLMVEFGVLNKSKSW